MFKKNIYTLGLAVFVSSLLYAEAEEIRVEEQEVSAVDIDSKKDLNGQNVSEQQALGAQEVIIIEVSQEDLEGRVLSKNQLLQDIQEISLLPINEKDFFTSEQKDLVTRIKEWQKKIAEFDEKLFESPRLLARELFDLFAELAQLISIDTTGRMYTQLPNLYGSMISLMEQSVEHLACKNCFNYFEKEGLDAFCIGKSSKLYCVSCRSNIKLLVAVAVLNTRCFVEYMIGLFEEECLQGEFQEVGNKVINRYTLDLAIPYKMIGLDETIQSFYKKNGIEFYLSLHAGPLHLHKNVIFADNNAEYIVEADSDDCFDLVNFGIVNLRWILLDSFLWKNDEHDFLHRAVVSLNENKCIDLGEFEQFKKYALDLTNFYKEEDDVKKMVDDLALLDKAYRESKRISSSEKYNIIVTYLPAR